jgi:hypothetical protein
MPPREMLRTTTDAHPRVIGRVAIADQSADPQAAVGQFADRIETGDVRNVDELYRLRHAAFHQVQQIRPAADKHNARLLRRLDRRACIGSAFV